MRFGGTLAIIGGASVLAAAGGWWYFNPFNRGPLRPRPAVHLPAPPPVNLDMQPIGGRALAAQPQPEAIAAPRATERLVAPERDGELTRVTPEGDGKLMLVAAEEVPVTPEPAAQDTPPGLRRIAPPADSRPISGPESRAAAPTTQPPTPFAADIAAAIAKLESGKTIEARHELNALLSAGSQGKLSAADAAEVRARLSKLANDTIFSRRIVSGDPLVETYTVQPGDRLIHIARKYEVPHEILMEINGIRDATTIRAGQKLKVVRGPFHARIHKSEFRLDVYVGELYVRSYPVGLGMDDGTPEGVWRVRDRLENPTYYPSASAVDKRIIPPDDPTNPLGEYWIGLEGIAGAAVGHEGYGIHGTIEPDSIGKAVSLGCVRMHNEDVALLFKMLLPGKSTVTVGP